MVMHLYSLLTSATKTGAALTEEAIEKGLDGNICRCTGYRPILDAMKSFATPAIAVPSAEPAIPPTPLPRAIAMTAEGISAEYHTPTNLDAAYRLLASPGAVSVCGHTGACLPYTQKDPVPVKVYVDLARIAVLGTVNPNPNRTVAHC